MFVNKMYERQFPEMAEHLHHPFLPNATFPNINSPWVDNERQDPLFYQLLYQFKHDQVYPEYIFGHYADMLLVDNGHS